VGAVRLRRSRSVARFPHAPGRPQRTLSPPMDLPGAIAQMAYGTREAAARAVAGQMAEIRLAATGDLSMAIKWLYLTALRISEDRLRPEHILDDTIFVIAKGGRGAPGAVAPEARSIDDPVHADQELAPARAPTPRGSSGTPPARPPAQGDGGVPHAGEGDGRDGPPEHPRPLTHRDDAQVPADRWQPDAAGDRHPALGF
jgi:hypothetical protein